MILVKPSCHDCLCRAIARNRLGFLLSKEFSIKIVFLKENSVLQFVFIDSSSNFNEVSDDTPWKKGSGVT